MGGAARKKRTQKSKIAAAIYKIDFDHMTVTVAAARAAHWSLVAKSSVSWWWQQLGSLSNNLSTFLQLNLISFNHIIPTHSIPLISFFPSQHNGLA